LIHHTNGFPSRDLIEIAARHGVVPRVEAVRHLLDGDDVDVGWQLVVQLPAQRLGSHRRVELEVRDLRERVHAGIGPARAVELELAGLERFADGAVDLTLDRAGVLLDLPAAVARAGVLDQEAEARHTMLLGARC
jgi:hypothetical protein